MPLKFDSDYLLLAIEDKQLPDNDNIQLIHKEIGTLKLISGHLIACDPYWMRYNKEAYTQKLPIGEYPVSITIVQFSERTDERITFAAIHLANTKPIRWEMMLRPKQDVSKLNDEQFYGYGVDAGTGCFVDQKVAEYIDEDEFEQEMVDKLDEEMKERYEYTRTWGSIKVKDISIVVFSSGWGDGSYPTFAGFDENNQLVAVVTDFMCIYHEFHGNNENAN